MQRTCVMAVVLACAAAPVAAVNKCTDKDGAVSYQDAPCTPAAANSARVKVGPDSPVSAGGGRSSAKDASPPQPLNWLGNPTSDLARAEALLDAIHTQGRDCEWALKVTRGATIATECLPFAGRLREGGDYAQVADRLRDLMRDEGWAGGVLPALRRCTRLMNEVVRQKELMLAHLGVR